ncbi:MAG TPA: carboxypeptidase-like regulatory domain-containing protein [Acidobacteriaceae bacterium]|nr:carboxypeptidase-like regulatory domain-containing protein [Acidobacteriaceae bacterium]
MNRRFSIYVPLSLAIALLWAVGMPAEAQTNNLTGVVRDSRGTPQAGAVVQLLRSDFSVVNEVYTDDHGHYRMDAILPGIYEVKAAGSLFLPTLRENLRVLGGSKLVVNLTLNTLYEAFRWLPAKPRPADEPRDDWTWTLRLSANRPLLRLLQNGPLVVVDSGDGSAPELKARVTVRGGESGFGDGGVHNDFEMERTPDDGRAMIFRADLSQAEAPAVNSMLGYEQQLAPGRTFRAIGAIESRPDVRGGPGSQGLQAIEMRSGETTTITESLQAEFGDETEGVHLSNTVLANHPFAALTLRPGNMMVAYRISTAPGIQQVSDLDREATIEPALAERSGRLALEQGMHQEFTVGRNTDNLHMRMTAWHEHVENPVISGGGTISPADWSQGNLLYDQSSDLLRAAGPNFTGSGLLGEVEEQVNSTTWISFDLALGDALTMASAAPGTETVAEALDGAKARPMSMYSAAVRGKLASTGTQWRASYRWQNSQTVTGVDAFAAGRPDPYLSLLVRQPIHYHGILPNGVEALVDVTNLLAEGYRPFVSRDGSSLYFAQAPRCIEGGLSFTF